MLLIAGMLDFLGIICFILVFAFGVGAVLGRFVSGAGLAIIGIWRFVRSSGAPTNEENPEDKEKVVEEDIETLEAEKEERGKRQAKRDAAAASGGKGRKALAKAGAAKDKIKEILSLSAFLKKHWKKFLVEAVPILGDIYPAFVIMVISELK